VTEPAVQSASSVGKWQLAEVIQIRPETNTAKTFTLRLERPTPHLAGQHLVVRLSAPDGYFASRSYSIASAPNGGLAVELTIERLKDGEVSAFLHDEVVVGDTIELRGPIGGWFVWRGDSPALLVGGGSGVVPLMAMLRLARSLGNAPRVYLLDSVRTPEDLYYRPEIFGPETTVLYTRRAPAGSTRPPGRITKEDLAALVCGDEVVYICGSSGFADAASEIVMNLGVREDRIRIERFGPTG
jgi:ferredoxin-NADP reductase